MVNRFPYLFSSVDIGKVKIKNRIVMAPMGIKGLTNPDGSLTQRAIDYYIERARGGVGLIITSLFKVENEIDRMVPGIPLVNRAGLAPLSELSESVHSLGTKIFIQLTAGWGRVAMPGVRLEDTPVSASPNPNFWNPKVLCRELSIEEIERIVKAFGDAAQFIADAGIDGIELHGHEGYLFDQFTTAIWNKRKDKYGGDLKGRLTFPLEVLKEIKGRIGEDFPVQYRLGLKHFIKGLNEGAVPNEQYIEAGRDIEEGLEMAELLEGAGFAALHVDAGCYDSWYWPHPPMYQEHGCMIDMAARVKKIVRIPVIAVGRLDIPELAEKVIKDSKADMVALGRGLLADPYWPIKVQNGRLEDIRPCIACHEGCLARLVPQGRPLSCAVNPACGRERLYELNKNGDKKILIVGGGVAGMEAARVASLRGHGVVLYEKRESLGGHLIEASVPDFKNDLERLNSWYKRQMTKVGIEVKLKTEVTKEIIEKENPAVVIIATGSKFIVPQIPGIEKDLVVSCTDLLLRKREVGNSIAVIGAGFIGCEIALWLAQQGKIVTVIEKMPESLVTTPPMCHANRIMLLDLLAHHKVKILNQSTPLMITENGVLISNNDYKKREIEADNVISAIGLKSDDRLYETLAGEIPHLYKIRDCVTPEI